MKQKAEKKIWAALLALSCGMSVGAVQSVQAAMEVGALEGITVEAKRPDWEGKLSPGSVNIVRPEEFKGEQKTLPDLLQTVPGVHVREVNGKGQYTTVTIRGSTAAQVGIFIDGVLANLGGDSAVDLSTIPVTNVERVEVYRGYIPSRFGGTFMGGVVNIVTKKPQATKASAELGMSSYGGKKAALEVSAPLGDGTIMFGTNYESSDGDFAYENYAAERYISYAQEQIEGINRAIADFNADNIDILAKGNDAEAPLISLSDDQIEYYKNNADAWESYVRNETGGLSDAITSNRYNYAEQEVERIIDTGTSNIYLLDKELSKTDLKEQYLDVGWDTTDWYEGLVQDWKGNPGCDGILTDETKQEIIKSYADRTVSENIETWTTKADPEKSESLAEQETNKKKLEKSKSEAENNKRWRKYNDYEKTNTILKWQDAHWVVKGTYETMDRHMPDSVWLGDANAAVYNYGVDLYDKYYYDSRRQKQKSASLLVQRRQEVGKLEWGWMLNYLHQDKKYRAEHINTDYPDAEWDMQNTPLREWSQYKSTKYTGQIDGTYKINDRHMLDFLINFSRERLDIDGSNMGKILSGATSNQNKLSAQIRNRYEQELFNIQVQDSITLDKKGSLILTPGLRYNQSKITGYSDGSRFEDGMYSWISPKDSMTKGKFTWQLALKKVYNDNLTVRMTGGTYYRLLNMAEIAGDGAGILPAPMNRNGDGAIFPVPEDGKQFDISFLTHAKWFGARNETTITYFWREANNMLQLERAGKDYWSYFNDNKGRASGIEFQTSFKWKKIDLDLELTYTKSWAATKHEATGDQEYREIWPTYQPKWEGNVRLTYRPNEKWSVFGECHYTSEYFTYSRKAESQILSSYMAGMPVGALTVMNLGLKYMPTKNWQFTVGCNDVFNSAPRSKLHNYTAFMDAGYINPEFPVQGRLYYMNIKYMF